MGRDAKKVAAEWICLFMMSGLNSQPSNLPKINPQGPSMTNCNIFHVDVFATGPLSGNGLTVFLDTGKWPTSMMQRLTREMKQFESIFLSEISPDGAAARVFTVEEELPFAGHPVLGAAAVLHRNQPLAPERCAWILRLAHGPVPVTTQKMSDHYLCEMNQGIPELGPSIAVSDILAILRALNMEEADLVSDLPARVISTGLPYLIIPVSESALAKVKIAGNALEKLLAPLGAKFVFVFDVGGREIRTWDNLGLVEDVATGSAAGPAAAYLLDQGLADAHSPVEISQGRFAGRPSKISIVQDQDGNLLVSGKVWPVSHGVLEIDPVDPDGACSVSA